MSVINLPRSSLARLGARWGKATGQIMGANIAAQVIGLFTAIFLTYFMAVSTYGRYAIAVFYASLLTHIINSGLLQGAFLTVFGAGGDDDDDGGDDDSETSLFNAEWFDRRLAGMLAEGLDSDSWTTGLLAAPAESRDVHQRGAASSLPVA